MSEFRWKCDEQGCFNTMRRPRFNAFKGCLPGNIAFTDIDMTVEVNGQFLFCEFKHGDGCEIPKGQQIYLERLTRALPSATGIIISGDASSMDIRAIRFIRNGKWGRLEDCNKEQFRERLSAWSQRARGEVEA